MKLKTLMLKKRMDAKITERNSLLEEMNNLNKRSKELEEAISEIETEEEADAIEEVISEHEKETEETNEKIENLNKEIEELDKELKETEEKQKETIKEEPKEREKMEVNNMVKRYKDFNFEERKVLAEREDVKTFVEQIRGKGGIAGKDVVIPTPMLGIIESELPYESKMLKYVNVIPGSGNGRFVVTGERASVTWVDAEAAIPESEIAFSQLVMSAYKACGYIAIPNSILEDNDINLVGYVIKSLTEALAAKIDEAILTGTGNGMPLGIVTRLEQATKPENYDPKAREWKDLSKTNVVTIQKTEKDKLKAIMEATASAKLGEGPMFFAMNHKTAVKIKADTLNHNSGVTMLGIKGEMPFGGDIVEVDSLADDVIVFGYGKSYVFVPRKNITVEESAHVKFIDDQTVFKATVLADGKPAIAESFVEIKLA